MNNYENESSFHKRKNKTKPHTITNKLIPVIIPILIASAYTPVNTCSASVPLCHFSQRQSRVRLSPMVRENPGQNGAQLGDPLVTPTSSRTRLSSRRTVNPYASRAIESSFIGNARLCFPLCVRQYDRARAFSSQ